MRACCVMSPPADFGLKAAFQAVVSFLFPYKDWIEAVEGLSSVLSYGPGRAIIHGHASLMPVALSMSRQVAVVEELSYHQEARSHGPWYLLGRCLAASSLWHLDSPWHAICGETADSR
jgi:hypothetical protein